MKSSLFIVSIQIQSVSTTLSSVRLSEIYISIHPSTRLSCRQWYYPQSSRSHHCAGVMRSSSVSCTSTVRVNFPSCTSPRSFFFQTSLTYTEADPCFNLEIQICSLCLSRAGLGKIVAYLYPNGKIVSKRPSLPLLTLAGAAPCFQPIASRQIETAAGASPVQKQISDKSQFINCLLSRVLSRACLGK